MKKRKIWMMLAIAFVSLCTVGCGGDDEESGINQNDLIGVWEEYYTAKYDLEGNLLKEETKAGSTIEFQSDGIYYWRHKGSAERSSWKLTGNKLVIYGDEYYRIISLSAEELELKFCWEDQGFREGIDGGYNSQTDEITKYRRIK